ncbi:Kelch repeat-containing protein [Winogradskyella tangerina]|uniref:Kelch repeat-containing protein n=1 Tax=Winogradskyella tangerina TaxID=2023240 RepID=UPI000DBE6271|nr:carboxypeptidase-like regulatory domain-containing protein [Winogradskyella tangerina]
MKPLIITLCVSIFVGNISAQTIKGEISNKNTNAPIENAHIYFSKKKGAVSDAEGKFKFRYKEKYNTNDSIYISHVGFATKAIHISEAKKSNLRIFLEPKDQRLSETWIDAGKELKSNIEFTELTSLSQPLFSFAAGMEDDKIYVVGGENSYVFRRAMFVRDVAATRFLVNQPNPVFDLNFRNYLEGLRMAPSGQEQFSSSLMVYDIPNDSWEVSDIEFRKRSGHNLHIYDDDIYVFGGKRPVSTGKKYLDHVVEVYNTDTNKVRLDETNPNQAVNFASFLYNDYLITLGGIKKINKNGSRKYSEDIYFCNLKTGYWYKLGEMPNPKETKGILVKDKIYLVGGFNGFALTSIESFDLITGEWKQEGELFQGMERPGLAYSKGTIYIYNDGRILTYNLQTGILNEYKIRLNLKYAELFYNDGKLYILGGYKQDLYSDEPSSGLYSIDINEFYKTKINNSKKIKWFEDRS